MSQLPTDAQRIAVRARGVRHAAMYQRWTDLLFLHWRWDPADLRARLPAGLHLDTCDGDAWLGVVPFFMERIRPRFLPPLPWVSWFLEMNVRTYVFDEHGTPGVWFFSLDCNQPIAVRVARRFFGLPYFDATMRARRAASGIDYECRRSMEQQPCAFEYSLHDSLPRPEPGSLEFWLVERYALFASTTRGLRLGQVEHAPYPLARPAVARFSALPLLWDGFAMPDRAPDHVAASRGVDVRIGALESPTQS